MLEKNCLISQKRTNKEGIHNIERPRNIAKDRFEI
jgi:hypothetical protein